MSCRPRKPNPSIERPRHGRLLLPRHAAHVERWASYQMPQRLALTEGLALVFQGIQRLSDAFPARRCTIDGRLVGDVGEVIAELEYDIALHEVSQPEYDGITSDGRRVQVNATFKESLTFKTTPDYFLGFKFYEDGRYEEVVKGPRRLIFEKGQHRAGIGTTLLSFPNSALRELSRAGRHQDRIPKRGVLPTSTNEA